MRKRFLFFSTLILSAWGMLAPASAEVRVDQILFNQAAPLPEATNVRVNLINAGVVSERPTAVELHIRGQQDTTWRVVKTWSSQLPGKIAPGERLSLDYLPAPGEVLDPALTTSDFELRAVVFGANGQLSSLEVQP